MLSSGQPVLEINNLTKVYGKLVAVHNLNITVKAGTIHGFLGPNGAGKTTTIRCCLGLLKPTSGTIRIFDKQIGSNNVEILRKIGYVPGDISLYNYYTVKELIEYFETLHGLQHAPLRDELVRRLDLDIYRPVKTLSKGNRQKVGIVLALMHDPEFLILDELTSGLDPLMQNEIYKILVEFRDRQKTIFFSSHILSEVDRLCDKVSIIRSGELVSTEDIKDLSMKIKRKIILKFSNHSHHEQLDIPNMKYIQSEGDSNIYMVTGEIKQIIKNISNLPNLIDFSIPEPNIEDYFMQFYKE